MKKALVAYFSAGGVTAKLAERLSSAIGAELFEIRPATPYSSADLDWTNPQSRSSVEMKNKAFRPPLATEPSLDAYDVIFVGFPIWWYVAPTIVNTFLESSDLVGKTIVPFATSGGSGMGNTNKELLPSCRGARLVEGRKFSSSVSADELRNWAKSFL